MFIPVEDDTKEKDETELNKLRQKKIRKRDGAKQTVERGEPVRFAFEL